MLPTLTPQIKIGAVHLTIPSLERSLLFYVGALGMKMLDQKEGLVSLGAGQNPLVVLVENPTARRKNGVTGLYHFAVRLPSRIDLARLLLQLSEQEVPLEGVGDHGVSESLYLPDVDGNGIELYADRPPEAWPRVEASGQLRMGTEPLDLDGLLEELEKSPSAWDGIPPETCMGHVHLHVADLAAVEHFYHDILGFDITQKIGTNAAFFAVGGYHHQVAVNTWMGTNAPPLPAGSIGLRYFEILLPDPAALAGLRTRLEATGLAVEAQEGGLLVRDPSQNGILLKL
jgi:catechol 2,3-dioxygenase